jgi:hypothetical protein
MSRSEYVTDFWHPTSAGEVVTVRIEADMKSNITFYVAILTGVCTLVTTTGFLLS